MCEIERGDLSPFFFLVFLKTQSAILEFEEDTHLPSHLQDCSHEVQHEDVVLSHVSVSKNI